MTGKRARREPKGFTDRELDIMSVLWREGSGTVTEVRKALGEEVGYTTVLKMLQILEEKGAVGHEQEGARVPLLPAGGVGAGGRARAHANREQDLPRFGRDAARDAGGGARVHRGGTPPHEGRADRVEGRGEE